MESDIPKGYYWAAVEPDGVAYAYKEMPYLSDDYNTWEPEEGSDYIKLEKKFDASNWKRSLITSHKNCKVFFENPTSDDIPEGYNYIAVSRYGRIYAFIQKPLIKEDYWKKTGNEPFRSVGIHLGEFDWKNSLVSRQLDKKILTVEDIPQGYNYAAVDEDGIAYAFKTIPELNRNDACWYPTDEENSLLRVGEDFDATNWTTSLVEKKTLKKLTVEDITEGYDWATVDSNGFAYAHQTKPIITANGEWKSRFRIFISSGFDSSNWEHSLIMRKELEEYQEGFEGEEHNDTKPEEINDSTGKKKLTVDHIPKGFNYAVVNANGTAFAYEEKPTQVMHGWIGLGETMFIDYDFDTANWENSLIQKEVKEPIEKSMNESEPVFLENCTFNFTQEANCKADTNDDEELEIQYTSDLGLDRTESGFFVLKTEGWSISDERDIKRLLDRIKLLMSVHNNK